ncbi:MAG TPA: T9SS type A sorting domain-containing protein [Bacteroidia bacterium]|nr:T9SS type A sorting domain-containing protein [Bacteroidia bacterium]
MKKHITGFFCALSFSAFTFLPATLPAQVWSAMNSGLDSTVNHLAFYHGQLVAGGVFENSGSTPAAHVAWWDGAAWQSFPQSPDGVVNTLLEYNGELYAGGSFSNAGGRTCLNIARWNGTAWDSVGGGITGTAVFSLGVYNGHLIAGGHFTMAGNTPASDIAEWDGSSWTALGSGVSGGTTDGVDALLWYGTDLIAGGHFTQAGTVAAHNIALWDGNAWSAMNAGFNTDVQCLCNFNGQLLAGGTFTSSGLTPVKRLGKWNGNAWVAAAGSQGADNAVTSMTTYGGKLFLCGNFSIIDMVAASRIVMYDGSNFMPMGLGLNAQGFSVAADDGIVYAGGNFTQANTLTVAHVAKWSAVGVGIGEFPGAVFTLFPNPSDGICFVSAGENETPFDITVYNMSGEIVESISDISREGTIDLTAQPAGIYFYRVTVRGKESGTGRIIRQ